MGAGQSMAMKVCVNAVCHLLFDVPMSKRFAAGSSARTILAAAVCCMFLLLPNRYLSLVVLRI